MAAITESDYLTTDLSSHASFSTTFADDGAVVDEADYDSNVGAGLGNDWATAQRAQNKANRGVSPIVSHTFSAGAATAAIALRFGATTTEGLELRVIDETVDLSSAAASFDLTQDIPSGAVILSAQANLETAITGASGATAVGIGVAADPDKYGESSALTLNTKVDTTLDLVKLGSAEDIRIYATDGAGTATGTIGGSSESVRVRIAFLALNSLDDA